MHFGMRYIQNLENRKDDMRKPLRESLLATYQFAG